MLRALCILSLALLIGAHKHDHSWRTFFENLGSQLDEPLQKPSGVFPEVSTKSSMTSSTDSPSQVFLSHSPFTWTSFFESLTREFDKRQQNPSNFHPEISTSSEDYTEADLMCESYPNCHPDSTSSTTPRQTFPAYNGDYSWRNFFKNLALQLDEPLLKRPLRTYQTTTPISTASPNQVFLAHSPFTWTSFFENLTREFDKRQQNPSSVYPEFSTSSEDYIEPDLMCESYPNCHPDSTTSSSTNPRETFPAYNGDYSWRNFFKNLALQLDEPLSKRPLRTYQTTTPSSTASSSQTFPAYKPDFSWGTFFENLARQLSGPLQKPTGIYPEVSTMNSEDYIEADLMCESYPDCHPDSTTSTASPVAKPGTLDDYSLRKDPTEQQVGSLKGIPGESFPDFTDIPATSFSCSDKEYMPGLYADLESGCQAFHACLPHRMESFLCPVGTTFNQALLACDYWYSSNCSLAPHYYNVNGYSMKSTDETKETSEGSMMKVLLGTGQESSKEELHKITSEPDVMAFINKFLPVKAKVTIFPETSDSKSKIVATASVGNRKKRHLPTTESKHFAKKPRSTFKAAVTEETRYSTRSPDCQPTIKYINVEAAVKVAFDRLDNIFKNMIREIKEYTAAKNAKKVSSTAYTDGISMLTKIKQKLAPRPLVPPVVKGKEPVIASKTDAIVPTSKLPVPDFHEKSTDSRIKHQGPTISPMTKKALIASYIKLLKLRKN